MEQCYFDGYCTITHEAISILSDTDRQRRITRAQSIDALREMLAVDPTFLDTVREVPDGLLFIKSHLRQTRPYILAKKVVQMALDMVEKAGTTAIPYEPFPKLPFWVEFDGVSLGDESVQFVAIWATRQLGAGNVAQVQLLCSDMQQSKTLFFDLVTGEWEYEQVGACGSRGCDLARYTVEGQTYRIRQSEAAEWMQRGCRCAMGGHAWAQLVNTINHILGHRKEPLREQITEREMRPPYQNPANRKEKIANSESRKKSRQNIITISLSAPVQVSQRRPGSSSSAAGGSAIEIEEKISIEGYWKVLMPGEGKPWKELKIIQVSSYERRQPPAAHRDRYRVEE